MINNILKIFSLIAISFSLVLAFGCDEKTKKRPFATLIVKSSPEGAKITLNKNKIKKATPWEANNVYAKPYMVKVEKEGYHTQWKKVVCSLRKTTVVKFKLKPITSSVVLTTTPSNVALKVDGRPVGYSPVTLHNIKAGEHTVLAEKPGFSPKEKRWTVTNEFPQKVNVPLVSNVGTLVVKSNPIGAKLLIDGKSGGQTPWRGQIEKGEYNLELVKTDYDSHRQMVVIKRDKTESVNVNLNIQPGSISVISKPTGAKVLIDNVPRGETPAVIKNIKPGSYTVKVEKNGCDPEEMDVVVVSNKEASAKFTMNSYMGGIKVVVKPHGTKVYLDGKYKGRSQPTGKGLFDAKIFSFGAISPGKHIIRIYNENGRPQAKSIAVTVKKGEIYVVPKALELWVANAIITHKDNSKVKGRLMFQNKEKISFQPEPGVTQTFKWDEIKSLDLIEAEEETE